MLRLLTRDLALLAALLATPACFADQVTPPTFRNDCSQSSDCKEGDACIAGLCERPCTQATAVDDCPTADGYATCVNGACASLCELEAKDICPGTQTCVDLGLDSFGGGGGFVGGGDTPAVGVCTAECSANSCPSGETCLVGFCVASCTLDTDCATGLVCFGGYCTPDFGGSGDTSTGGSTSAGTSSTSGAAP